MKTKPSITTFILDKIAIMIAFLGFGLIPNIQAQSADIFQSLSGTSQTTNSGDLTGSNPDIQLLKSKPSRYALGSAEQYTAARMADFSMKSRAIDIFGLQQNPDVKPVIKNTTNFIKKGPTNLAPIALSEIVKGLSISTVMVKEKSFLVGERVLREAEEFPISYKNSKPKNVKVIKVESKQIIFKDLNTGEEAILKLDILPLGMKPGDDRLKPLKPNGMVEPSKNASILLEIN